MLKLAVAVLSLAIFCSAQQQPQIGYQAAPDADAHKTLLLKDFHPVPMLHTPVHKIDKAKFYVIDVHNHVNDAARIDEHMDPKRVVEVMDNTNVRTIVILTGMWGDKLQHVIDEMVKPYPGRFIVFAQIDYSKIDDPNFSQEAVANLDDAVKRGARGLKCLKDLGLGVRDKSGKLIAVDDPRLDPIWEEAGRLHIPVSIHTSDPEAFFHPTNGENERYEELTEHPDWSFYSAPGGPQFPSKEELLAARDRVFARHPHTQFVALHMANWPENLDYVVCSPRSAAQRHGRVWRARSRTWPPAPPRPRVLPEISGPHHVRHRQRSHRRNVSQPLPLARNRRRIFRLLGIPRPGPLGNLRHGLTRPRARKNLPRERGEDVWGVWEVISAKE